MAGNLRDILPPTRRMEGTSSQPVLQDSVRDTIPVHRVRRRKHFPYGILLGALVLIIAVVAFLFVFGVTSLTLTSAKIETFVSTDMTASLKEGEIPYELITVEKKAHKSAPAEGTERVETFSEGTISISNTYKESQPLIKNTRFQSASGLIYRIRESVTIPSGSAEKPGTLTVRVYADQPGDTYNIPPGTFTIPGLKDAPIESYLRSVSSTAFEGGFVGERPTVTKETRDSIVRELQKALEQSVEEDLLKDVPKEYVYVKGGATTTFEVLPNAGAGVGTASVQVLATTKAVVFKNDLLAKAIAQKTLPHYTGEKVRIANPETLSLIGVHPHESASNFSFVITGKPTLEYVIDEKKIRGLLAGKSITAGKVILNELPEIDKAELSLRPFFRTEFPTDDQSLSVTIE